MLDCNLEDVEEFLVVSSTRTTRHTGTGTGTSTSTSTARNITEP